MWGVCIMERTSHNWPKKKAPVKHLVWLGVSNLVDDITPYAALLFHFVIDDYQSNDYTCLFIPFNHQIIMSQCF